jgi:hypothetical protein
MCRGTVMVKDGKIFLKFTSKFLQIATSLEGLAPLPTFSFHGELVPPAWRDIYSFWLSPLQGLPQLQSSPIKAPVLSQEHPCPITDRHRVKRPGHLSTVQDTSEGPF